MNEIDVALICKALGDANRLKIVRLVAEKERCGCDLLEEFKITQPTLSHHMRVLIDAGLVNIRKEGKWSHYSINCEQLALFRNFISSLNCNGDNVCQ